MLPWEPGVNFTDDSAPQMSRSATKKREKNMISKKDAECG